MVCHQQNLARQYAFADMVSGRRNRAGRLRQLESLVIRDVSFTVEPGQPLMVVGARGAGKTTLVDLITGLQVADCGTVDRRGTVGVVAPGKFGHSPFIRLHEYVRLVGALNGIPVTQQAAFCEEVLDWTGLGDARDTLLVDLAEDVSAPVTLVGSLLAQHDVYLFDDYKPLDQSQLGLRLSERVQELVDARTCVFFCRWPQALPGSRPLDLLLLHGGEVLYRGTGPGAARICERFVRVVQSHRASKGWNASDRHKADPPAFVARAMVRDIQSRVDRVAPQPDHDGQRIADSQAPVIAGPCLEDAGWEVLFWLPFLRWVAARRPRGFQLAVSMRGLPEWYTGVSEKFVSMSQLIDWQTYRQLQGQQLNYSAKNAKRQISALDARLVELGADVAGLANPELLHPARLLELVDESRRGRVPAGAITAHAVYARLPSPDKPVPGLPESYVVVLYRKPKTAGTDTSADVRLSDLVRRVSQHCPVVVLVSDREAPVFDDSGLGVQTLRVDDIKDSSRIQARARVIGKARAMIAFGDQESSALAPFLGVPLLILSAAASAGRDVRPAVMAHAAAQLQVPLVFTNLDGSVADRAERWLVHVMTGSGVDDPGPSAA